MTAYYNEFDPYAAQWLRDLIAAGHLAKGEVDERSITEVQHEDLSGFDQCHFFAGIGVWGYALRQAGWADDRPVWTGSCPCQPFSSAGKQEGFADERHLWPAWFNLIRKCRPPVLVGEQVASALDWLDLVSTDMESADYAFGASDLCAAGFGGAHIRQRLYWMANANNTRSQGWLSGRQGTQREDQYGHLGRSGAVSGLADTGQERHNGRRGSTAESQSQCWRDDASRCAEDDCDGQAHAPMLGRGAADWLFCTDGKWRPVRPGTFPLAHGAPARVGRLRAYGNALDAQTATQFVAAVMDCAP